VPQPFQAYAKALEAKLLRTREALRQALEDKKYVVEKTKIISHYKFFSTRRLQHDVALLELVGLESSSSMESFAS